MKKALVFALVLMLVAASSSMAAGWASGKGKVGSTWGIEFGMHNPQATDAGFAMRLNSIMPMDDRVQLSASLGFFRASTTDEEKIRWEDPANPGTYIDTVITNFESALTMIPITGNIQLNFPMAQAPVIPFVAGGLGYNLAWNSYDNYETKEGETKFYSGFGWWAGAGVEYPFGTNTALTAQVNYTGTNPSRKEENGAGFPVRTELDMSGLGFMVGLRVSGF